MIRRRDQGQFDRGPLAVYYTEINATPLLSAGEEKDLAYQIQEGDSSAREHLVRANLRLVVSIARGYVGKGLDLPDLIAEGNLGLLRAVEGFDPTMGTRFSTYAGYWIRQSVKRGLVNMGRTIRVPSYTNELMTKWRYATARLRDELDRPPTPEEVAQRLKLSRRKLQIVKRALQIHNLALQAAGDDDAPSFAEALEDRSTPAPDAEMMQSDQLRQLFALLDQLDERAQKVLRLRFGLDGGEPRTLQEIGTTLELTRERVRQIEGEALRHLRDLMDVE
jgi:RNA polymerase primary sigma factor